MTSLTDPARDLAELCRRLSGTNPKAGDVHLAKIFEVESTSTQFYEIVFAILKQADLLDSTLKNLLVDDQLKETGHQKITHFKQAFSLPRLANTWTTSGNACVAPANADFFDALSPAVRQRVCYPRLTEEERNSYLQLIEEILNIIPIEQSLLVDSYRQSIYEGLSALRFRLEKLNWLGWGYTYQSLYQVVDAYNKLYENQALWSVDFSAELILKKLGGLIGRVIQKANEAKGVQDSATWLLTGAGLRELYDATTQVAGYLPHLP